jgi:hypothetical protein
METRHEDALFSGLFTIIFKEITAVLSSYKEWADGPRDFLLHYSTSKPPYVLMV